MVHNPSDYTQFIPYLMLLVNMQEYQRYMPFIMLMFYIWTNHKATLLKWFSKNTQQCHLTLQTNNHWWIENQAMLHVNHYISVHCKLQFAIVTKNEEVSDVPHTRLKKYRPVIEPTSQVFNITFQKNPISIQVGEKPLTDPNVPAKKFIDIRAGSIELIHDFLANCQQQYIDHLMKDQNMYRLFTYSKESRWKSRTINVEKNLSNVALNRDIRDSLIKSLENFKSQAFHDINNKLGLPNKVCYMFCGSPGCGKTSTVYMMSKYLNYPVFSVPSLDSMSSEEMENMFDAIPQKVIVLFEELDCYDFLHHRSKESSCLSTPIAENTDLKPRATPRDDSDSDYDCDSTITNTKRQPRSPTDSVPIMDSFKRNHAKLKVVLEFLDGYTSLNNSIVVLTSNHPEKIDSAVLRPGRVDHVFQFKHAEQQEIKEIFPYISDDGSGLHHSLITYRSSMLD